MSIEKRRYPRYFFTHEPLPRLNLQTSDRADISAELLNISIGGMCLSLSADLTLEQAQLEMSRITHLVLGESLALSGTSLKLCYFYHATDLNRIICGLSFCDLSSHHQSTIQHYIQDNADDIEQIYLS